MSDPAPPQYSDDGKWWWDGQQWQPVTRPAGVGRRPQMLWVWVAAAAGALLVCGFCGVALVGLSGGGGPSGGGDVAGNYALTRLNGQSIPAGIAGRIVIDGSFELRSDSTWTMRLNWRGELGYSRFLEDIGTFTRNGESLRFEVTSTEADAFTGHRSGDTLNVQFDFSGDGRPEQFTFAR